VADDFEARARQVIEGRLTDVLSDRSLALMFEDAGMRLRPCDGQDLRDELVPALVNVLAPDYAALQQELAREQRAKVHAFAELEAIRAALDGQPVSDFMENFEVVRAAVDARYLREQAEARAAQAEQERDDYREAFEEWQARAEAAERLVAEPREPGRWPPISLALDASEEMLLGFVTLHPEAIEDGIRAAFAALRRDLLPPVPSPASEAP